MVQLQLVLKRLKKPSVIASLTSQVMTLLLLFNIEIDTTLITSVISSVMSIFVILGIFSNPDAKKRGYRDDISQCTKCGKMTQHVPIGSKMICAVCGCSSNERDI